MSKLHLRIHWIQVTILFITIVLSSLVLHPIRQEAIRRSEALRNKLIGDLEESAGIQISYQSVSPALLSVVTIRGLRVAFHQGEFEAKRLRIFYKPLRYFGNRSSDLTDLISRIVLIDGKLKLNVETASSDTEFDPWPFLSDKTVIMSDFSVHVLSGERNLVDIQDLSLTIRSDNEGIVRYLVDGSLETRDIEFADGFGQLKTVLSSSGRFSSTDSTVNGRLDIVSAESNVVVLVPQSLDFTYSEEALVVRRIADNVPIDVTMRWTSDLWAIEGEAVNLSLGSVAAPGSSFRHLDPWFTATLDGRFEMYGTPETGISRYDFDMSVNVPPGEQPWPMDGRFLVQGTKDAMVVEDLSLSVPWGRSGFQGTVELPALLPNGELSLDVHQDVLGYPVDADFVIDTHEGVLTADPIQFEAGGMEFHDFRFLVIRETDSLSLSMYIVPGLPQEENPREIIVDAFLDFASEPSIHGFAAIQGFETSHLADLAGLNSFENLPFFQNSSLDVQGFFEANRDSWVLSVDQALWVSKDNPEDYVAFRGRAVPGSWSIDSLKIAWNELIVDGRGYAAGDASGGQAHGRFVIQEHSYPLEVSWYNDGSVTILGGSEFQGELGPRTVHGRFLQILSEGLLVPLQHGVLEMNLDLRGLVGAPDWDLSVGSARIGLSGREGFPDLETSFNGVITPAQVDIPSLVVTHGQEQLSGNAVFDTSYTFDALKGRLFLGSGDDENYEVFVEREGAFWDIDIGIYGGKMARFRPGRLEGRLNLDAQLTGSLANPVFSMYVESSDGSLDGSPFEIAGSAFMESGRLRIQDVLFTQYGIALSRGLIFFDMNKGTMRSTGEMEALYNQVPISTGFSLGVDFEQSISLADIATIAGLDYTGTLAIQPTIWDSKVHFPAYTFQFARTQDAFKARTPDGQGLDLLYRFDTNVLDVNSDSPLPVKIQGGGTIRDGYLDLSFPVLDVDPVLINYFMVRDPILLQYYVVFQSGQFIGNLDVLGPATDPDLNGVIRAIDLKVDTPYTYADIEPVSSKVRFEGNRIIFERIDVPVGDGLVYGYGYMVIDRWNLTDINMYYGGVATELGEGVPFYYPLLNVKLDGLFTGDVHLTGDGQRFYINGELILPYLKASLGPPILPVSQLKPGRYPKQVFLDLDIIAGRNCTFYLPNEQVKIVKATAESGQILNLEYSNDPETLSLKGELPIKSGDIFYFDRDFQITEGSMRFNETLTDFDPILDFRAETRVRDDNGSDVTVALVYNAPVMSDFNPRIETLPSRSEVEILALFGQAVVPYGEGGKSEVNTVLLATGGMFGQVGIVQPFEDIIREGLNLDMVTIRTDIIENTLAEGLGRGDHLESTTLSSGLGRYLDNTSLYAGKYIGNAIFVSGLLSTNYLEGRGLRSVFGGLEFETSVSLEMETPFLGVVWSYSPDPLIDEHFLADNEISLKWQFAF